MPAESKKAALARIEGEVYGDAFEAEFGQWPGKPTASDSMDMGRVDYMGNDSDIDSIASERAAAAGAAVLEDDVGDHDVDIATAEPMSIEDEEEVGEESCPHLCIAALCLKSRPTGFCTHLRVLGHSNFSKSNSTYRGIIDARSMLNTSLVKIPMQRLYFNSHRDSSTWA